MFRSIADSSLAAVLLVDRDLRVLYANGEAASITGFTEAELVGRGLLGLIDPASAPAVKGHHDRVRTGADGPSRFEFSIVRNDGRRRLVIGRAAVLRTPARDPETAWQFVDITELRRVEEESKHSQEIFKVIFDCAPDCIYLHDLNGFLIEGNAMAEKLTGYSKAELVGMNLLTAGFLPSEQIPKAARLLTWNYFGKPSSPDELIFRRKDGALIPVEIRTFPVTISGKTMILGIARDITLRKLAEEGMLKSRSLETARRAADAASQAKSTFLAHMSHEIRTPINAIMGFSELMQRDESLTPQQRKYLDVISRSGEHLLALITDVLEMSKIEAGRVTLNPTTFDLRALLGDLELMFRMRADAKKLAFAMEGLAGVPRYVEGDESKIRQILLNLLGNAVKFTESGGITLKVGVRLEDGGRIRLDAEVKDTGPGIPDEEQRGLFKPFEQARQGRLMRAGTGLGLAICKEFVTLMGGGISLESRPGEGSVFRFHVLLDEGDLGQAGQASVEPGRVKRLAPGQPARRVLVADDEELNGTFLCRLLGEVGFETRLVTTGVEAVEEFAAWRPDLILLDMKMPGLDGLEAARRIRKAEGGAAVKIIMVSASAFIENRREALEAGVDDYLTKPFREDVLFAKIAGLLEVAYEYEERPAPYGGDPRAAAAGGGGGGPAGTADLSGLPKGFLRKARAALVQADYDAIMDLIDSLGGRHAAESEALRGMVERFEYDRLLNLLTVERNPS